MGQGPETLNADKRSSTAEIYIEEAAATSIGQMIISQEKRENISSHQPSHLAQVIRIQRL